MYDVLVVGAGLYGASYARVLADAGKTVQVIERRPVVGGNCADEMISGVFVCLYGGHIFHTNYDRTFNFFSRFSRMIPYEHRVKAYSQGVYYSFPPNRATLEQLGVPPGIIADKLIMDKFFRGYTQKQWGRPIEQIPSEAISRIPIRQSYDDRYFSDVYQAIPKFGYSFLIKRMLDGIPVECGVDFCADIDYWRRQADMIVYSGSLDELLGYQLGRLEYASAHWETEVKQVDDYQGIATINYTDIEIPWKRVLEWKHYGWQELPRGETVVSVEYPGGGERLYPLADEVNKELYARYAAEAVKLPWLRWGGRLGYYRYLNMDAVIGRAMDDAQEVLHR